MASKGCKVTLYWLNKSRSQRVVWLLEELGIDYDVQVFHRQKDMRAPPELKQIHPLGKSPVISIANPNTEKPIVLAESGLITEYLIEHFGNGKLAPQHWQAGKESQPGGETEGWLRYRYYMHYVEGSLMLYLVMMLVASMIKTSPVPFFLRWLVAAVGDKVASNLMPQIETQLKFVEEQLGSAPEGGPFICGPQLTGADIMLSFPLQAGKNRIGITEENYPRITKYIELLESQDGYKRSVQKIVEVDGSFDGIAM